MAARHAPFEASPRRPQPAGPAPPNRIYALLLALVAMVRAAGARIRAQARRGSEAAARFGEGSSPFAKATEAVASFSSIGVLLLGVVVAILVPVLAVKLLASLAPSYFASLGELVTAFQNVTTGDPLTDDIAPLFASLVALIGFLAFLGTALVFVAIKVSKNYT